MARYYESPEKNSNNTDQRSAVYSLGAILYMLLTGIRPLNADLHTESSLLIDTDKLLILTLILARLESQP